MSPGIYASLTRRAALIAAAAGLALMAVLGSAGAASAHDGLIASDPAIGATVDALPEQVTLTFSNFPIDEPGATLMAVTDAACTDLTAGDPVVDGTDVTQALQGTATGVITVTWKITSSDGHPTEDQFTFTVGAGDAAATPAPADCDGTAAETSTATPETGSTPPALLWTIAGVVLAAVIAVVAYLLISRARRRRDLQRTREAAADSGDRRPDED
ncbi:MULTISPECIES: copper resistance CopC family protein [unclassified Microbacterium]|uniref:copper resistance CopC family protein n=1 Tax=unclassified Microbacterium TaxID=2609290 RepID=UPI00214AE9F7|nr:MULTISPECIES: copper resistance CopC family protein [unclassified Microbacterium]MCR2785906.1 copper resistance protein CopC [Microbacterium sp. zg.B96]MDL5349977.1 copper resistance protein CopC [Microbacterium sp. zg-YB36]WIM17576.1 copper resistance protein CopC [Microbacterium sp. zg-B96]